MKRLLACVSLVAATTTAVLPAPAPATKPTATPTPARTKPAPIRVAPADEYFGKLKMSVLGIRNTIKDVGANIEIDQTRWTQLAGKAEFTEDAMRDWEKKYPQDTWLAKMVFALQRMYAKLDSDDGRKRSVAAMKWLVRDFPKSWYGKTGKKELAAGKVGQPARTAAAAAPAAATATEGSALVAEPGALSSAAPVSNAGAATSRFTSDQASGSVAATPVPNPLPSISPGARAQER